MDDNNSLNKKYRKIDSDEAAEVKKDKNKTSKNKKEKAPKEKKPKKEKIQVTMAPKPKKEKQPKKEKPPKAEKPPKEKKIKEEKPPKEKKIKEEKPPKEKKIKEEKPPKEKKIKEEKPPKEKKIKEEKPPKEKKEKKEKPPKEKKVKEKKPKKGKNPKTSPDAIGVIENPSERVFDDKPLSENDAENKLQDIYSDSGAIDANENVRHLSDREEEIVVSFSANDGKKNKKEKPLKEKKVKTPKEKKEKPPKEPKEKKEKPPKEKKPREPLQSKDYITIFIAVLAVALVAIFVGYRYMISRDNPSDIIENSTSEDRLANIQIARNGVMVNLIQSDLPNVFYGFTSNYELRYYQYRNNKMVAVASTGSVSVNVDLGNQTLPVTIDYVELGDRIFGIGLFRSDQNPGILFYDRVVFKLTNLPKAYESDRKALLLASVSSNAITQGDILWTESFTVDLDSGETTRFLSVVNRNMDMNGAGVSDFCMLTKEGYSSTVSAVPFITAREYPADSGKQDIFVKNGTKETLFAGDVYGKFLLTDGNAVIYMKRTDVGFDVMRKTGDNEQLVRSFYGSMNSTYMNSGSYILNKIDGKLYNLKTGEEKTLIGFRMSPELMQVSPDGKYLVLLGTVNSMVDYQVHIFNLETGEYTKYTDKNYSAHSNLAFIDNTTAVYTVIDPNQGYEYVVINTAKEG